MNKCPCCGWSDDGRFPLDRIAGVAKLSRLQRKAFDVYAAKIGQHIVTPDVIAAVYGDEPDGGPEFADQCLTVLVNKMRKRIEPFGLTIESRQGAAGRRLIWVGDER